MYYLIVCRHRYATLLYVIRNTYDLVKINYFRGYQSILGSQLSCRKRTQIENTLQLPHVSVAKIIYERLLKNHAHSRFNIASSQVTDTIIFC